MSTDHVIKRCTKCKVDKPIGEFSRREKTSTKTKSACKECERHRLAELYATRRVEIRDAQAKYYIANRETIRASQAAYQPPPEVTAKARARQAAYYASQEGKNKEKARKAKFNATPEGKAKGKAQKAIYLAKPEKRAKIKARMAAFNATAEGKAKAKAQRKAYKARPEGRAKLRAGRIAYAVANRAVLILKAAAYRLANPEIGRRNCARRRARIAGVPIGDLKLITAWEKTWRTAKAVPCHWCGKKFPGKDMHSDHVMPIKKDGPHDVENLVVSCEACNLKKAAKLPADFNATLDQPLLFY